MSWKQSASSKNEDATSLRRNCHWVAMTQIGSRILIQGKIECGTKMSMEMWYCRSNSTQTTLLITWWKGIPYMDRDWTGRKKSIWGHSLSHIKTEKCRKAIRPFGKFSHSQMDSANPLQCCIYTFGLLDWFYSPENNWGLNLLGTCKSFVRIKISYKVIIVILNYLFLYDRKS